ncbi:hypothetical protein MKZ38_006541 [Zalerion maritima]|uniref:Cytochrome P450 n=1 Tax=Zalerion maritima TaxID=339359 RepID=A0AAD5RYR3_9PEZI|nr:hypothetical protein MKZ38_006541 [Zalerion maritima]
MIGFPPSPDWMPSWASSWPLIAVESLGLYTVGVVVYRRYFHPLAKVPGPFLPAVTGLYAWYYNVPKTGQFYKEIERLHKGHGPVVRIGPNEIHLSNPANYDKIYSIGGKFYKDPIFYGALGIEYSIFTSSSNEVHRVRRAPLNPFFSRRAVLGLQNIVRAKVSKLIRRMEKTLDSGSPFDVHSAVRAISVDVVTEYAFDNCWDQLDQPDLGAWFSDMVGGSANFFYTCGQFPFLVKPVQALPDAVARRLDKGISDMLDCVAKTKSQVTSVRERLARGEEAERTTIFHELMHPHAGGMDRAPEEVPSVQDLAGEAFTFTTAAADTTGNAINMACYNVVTRPGMLRRLREEVVEAYPDPDADMDSSVLEKLPFLAGVVKEGQRLSYGVISRLPRKTPAGGAEFDGFFVPEGTTVGMSSWMMHRNPDVFPDPDAFDPARWMGDAQSRAVLERNLVSFSKGSRMCLGQNLAMCEMYLTIASVFRRFDDLVSYETTDDDMVYVDCFSAFHPSDAKKFHVVRKSKAQQYSQAGAS